MMTERNYATRSRSRLQLLVMTYVSVACMIYFIQWDVLGTIRVEVANTPTTLQEPASRHLDLVHEFYGADNTLSISSQDKITSSATTTSARSEDDVGTEEATTHAVKTNPPTDETMTKGGTTPPVKSTAPASGPGLAACLLVMDDTMRLAEWIAYHYTIGPLQRLIIAIDPFTSSRGYARIHAIAQAWIAMGVDIVLWTQDSYVDELERNMTLHTPNNHKVYIRRQNHFAIKCMEDHAQHGQSWTLMTDTDEFLIYNHIQKVENRTASVNPKEFWKNQSVVDAERLAALPVRKALPAIDETTVMDYLNSNASSWKDALSKPACIRLAGLWFGSLELNDSSKVMAGLSNDTLQALNPFQTQTLRFQRHEAKHRSQFSKVIVDVSKVAPKFKFSIRAVNTIHNPHQQVCGRNGPTGSGADFSSAIFRIHHYQGSKEMYQERAGDARGRSMKAYKQKNNRGGPYIEAPDVDGDDIRPWANAFVKKVGVAKAKELMSFTDWKILQAMEQKVKAADSTPIESHSCPVTAEESTKMQFLRNVTNILNELDCPYHIHAGTLLNFVRDCQSNDFDIDIAIPLVWIQENNNRITKAMQSNGYTKDRQNFGKISEPFGFEVAFWDKKRSGSRVDFFTTVETPTAYYWALRYKGNPHRCTVKRTAVQDFQWGDITLRAPVPFDMALQSMYGTEWRKPYPGKWHWFHSAVKIGSCEDKPWNATEGVVPSIVS